VWHAKVLPLPVGAAPGYHTPEATECSQRPQNPQTFLGNRIRTNLTCSVVRAIVQRSFAARNSTELYVPKSPLSVLTQLLRPSASLSKFRCAPDTPHIMLCCRFVSLQPCYLCCRALDPTHTSLSPSFNIALEQSPLLSCRQTCAPRGKKTSMTKKFEPAS